jgi:hypothetical protein
MFRVLKYGAGEGWRRSVGLTMFKIRKYCIESRGIGAFYK